MNRTLLKRLDRLEEGASPDAAVRCWQIQIYSPQGPINGPVITWRPGQRAGESIDWTQWKEQASRIE